MKKLLLSKRYSSLEKEGSALSLSRDELINEDSNEDQHSDEDKQHCKVEILLKEIEVVLWRDSHKEDIESIG